MEGAWRNYVLLLVSVSVIVNDLMFVFDQRLRYFWRDSAGILVASATAGVLMPDLHGRLLAEVLYISIDRGIVRRTGGRAASIVVKHMAIHSIHQANGPHVYATPADRPRRDEADLQGHRADERA